MSLSIFDGSRTADCEKILTFPQPNDVDHSQNDIGGTYPSADFQPGLALGDRYEIISRLGSGGMGLVYKVRQVLLNRELALKTIDKRSMSETALRRFQQEARTAFSLEHPSIIGVKDFGLLEDQTPFLVMELVNGETLAERLKRTGTQSLEEAISIFVQVCFGLAYAHDSGVVHRDIKPSNIMLLDGLPVGSEGSVKIVDFGIAKCTSHEGGEIQALTRTGEIFGSPLYMSPEQCSGFSVDHRADIYSLGCVLFEALTGTPPFIGDNALSTMMKHQNEQSPTLREASFGKEFPRAIEDIVATMIAKSPDARYQSIGRVAHDLGAVKRGDSISRAARSNRVPAGKEPKMITITASKFYSTTICAGLALAIVSGALGYAIRNFQTPDKAAAIVSRKKDEVTNKIEPKSSIFPDLPKSTSHTLTAAALAKLLASPNSDHKLVLNNLEVSVQQLARLGDTPWIQDLEMKGCNISNENLDKLAPSNLVRLNVSESNFDDDGAEKLSKFKKLSILSASHTSISDKSAQSLAQIATLENLGINGTKITDKSFAELAKSKSLRILQVRNNVLITNNGLAALERTQLRHLDLGYTEINDEGMTHLSKMPNLNYVVMKHTSLSKAGLLELCRSRSIRTIEIQNCSNLTPNDLSRLRSQFPAVKFEDRIDD